MALSAEAVERLTAEATQIIQRYPQARSALLPMLHLVQSEEGFVSPDGIALCAGLLDLSTAEVSAVATFYTQYKLHPNGEYTVGVCTNTLCAVMGGDAIFDSLEEHLGVGHDETTEDGKVTLERIECNAACDYAPVMMVNWEFFDNQTPSTARDVVDQLRAGQPVVPTRGANTVATFKEVSKVLAGFDDGRAGEGIGAGEPSLRGTVLANQRGWRAPESEQASRRTPGATTSRADTASAAADVTARGAAGSGSDAPAVPAGTADRAGTTAGKPPGEATEGENDPGTGTQKEG
jgi:NADH-quinone oxidoreductase subunit E